MPQAAVTACPACGRPATDLARAESDGQPAARFGYTLAGEPLDCDGCRQLQRFEYSRIDDIALGGRGDVCPECLEPWARQRKLPLRQLDCETCRARKLTNMRRAGGYAAYAAAGYARRNANVPDDAQTRALMLKDESKAALTLKARWDKDLATPEAAREFVAICRHYDLDPFIGEIVPYQGRPFVTEMGWLRKVQEAAPGQLTAYESRIATDEERRQREAEDGDVLAYAEVERTYPNGQKLRLSGYGWVKARERRASQREETAMGYGNRVRPVVDDPWMMAEKRARVPLLRRLFADALRGIPLAAYEDVAVDAEAQVIAEEPEALTDSQPQPPPQAKPTRAARVQVEELKSLVGTLPYGLRGFLEEYAPNLIDGRQWHPERLTYEQADWLVAKARELAASPAEANGDQPPLPLD